MNGLALEVVRLGDGVGEQDLIVHDERNPNPAYAFLLSRMDATPGFPTPIGVLRAVDAPCYERQIADQVGAVTARKGKGDLARLCGRATRGRFGNTSSHLHPTFPLDSARAAGRSSS